MPWRRTRERAGDGEGGGRGRLRLPGEQVGVGARPRKGDDLEVKVVSPPHPPVDGQPRMSLQYEKGSGYQQQQVLFGATISVFLAVLAFGVIVAS